jgi:membrane associated rhomboid family serine protease
LLPVADTGMPNKKEFPVVNTTIILLNIIIFFIGISMPSLLLPGAKSYDEVVYALGTVPARLLAGRSISSVITSMFLHAGLTHLFGNMLYLYIFGDDVERAMGKAKYLLFYLISGVGATIFHLTSIILMPSNMILNAVFSSGINPYLIPAIGASGAISGVLGAYLVLFPSSEVEVLTFWGYLPIPLRMPAALYILIWFIFQLWMGLAVVVTGVQAGVAFWAHIGGFLTGIALLPLFASKKKLRGIIDYSLVLTSLI